MAEWSSVVRMAISSTWTLSRTNTPVNRSRFAVPRVLDALGEAASKLRGGLGESLATVQNLDVPLEQATTPSLEALKAYSLGRKGCKRERQRRSPALQSACDRA